MFKVVKGCPLIGVNDVSKNWFMVEFSDFGPGWCRTRSAGGSRTYENSFIFLFLVFLVPEIRSIELIYIYIYYVLGQ